MYKYWLVFRLSILDILEYRFDFLMHVSKYVFMVLAMSLVWISVNKAQGGLGISQSQLIGYFIISAMLYSLSNFHTYYIEDDIRLGHLSKFLVKPVSYFWYYFVFQLGHSAVETLIKALILITAILFFQVRFDLTLANTSLALAFLPLIFLCSFNIFTSISLLTFWIVEAWALRWSLTVSFRFLAGTLVPLLFFPPFAQQLSFYLPFQHLMYTPIMLLQNQISWQTGLLSLSILASWTAVLAVLRATLWYRGLQTYEGVGL